MIDLSWEPIEEAPTPFSLYTSINDSTLGELARKHFPVNSRLSLHQYHSRPHYVDWNDANHYLYLHVDEQPSAYVGWLFSRHIVPSRLSSWITVMQGVDHEKEPKPVPPSGWPSAFVQCVETISLQLGIEHVCITPAEQNMWYPFSPPSSRDGHVRTLASKQASMRRIYNETANSNGYFSTTTPFVLHCSDDEEVRQQPRVTAVFHKCLQTPPLVRQ